MPNVFEDFEEYIPEAFFIKQRNDGDFLIVQTPTMELVYLNKVAQQFFIRCQSGKKLGEIKAELLKIFEVTEDELTQDLYDLVRDLQWKHLIKMKEIV